MCKQLVASKLVPGLHFYALNASERSFAIMDNLGYSVKSSDDLLRSPAEARRVDAPETMGGGGA